MRIPNLKKKKKKTFMDFDAFYLFLLWCKKNWSEKSDAKLESFPQLLIVWVNASVYEKKPHTLVRILLNFLLPRKLSKTKKYDGKYCFPPAIQQKGVFFHQISNGSFLLFSNFPRNIEFLQKNIEKKMKNEKNLHQHKRGGKNSILFFHFIFHYLFRIVLSCFFHL